MRPDFKFVELPSPVVLSPLVDAWRGTLLAPEDGMWESISNDAAPWGMLHGEEIVGYANLGSDRQLLHFFVLPQWQSHSAWLFASLRQHLHVKSALVGTQDPGFLIPALQQQTDVKVHTLLFADVLPTPAPEAPVPGVFRAAVKDDLSRAVDYCLFNVGGEKEWMQGYLGNLIDRGELFLLEEGIEIKGTSEVRCSDTYGEIADVGMTVATLHRRKGIGTFLLGKAKELALQAGKHPICSCEIDNTGSRLAIEANGFRVAHQMLEITFD